MYWRTVRLCIQKNSILLKLLYIKITYRQQIPTHNNYICIPKFVDTYVTQTKQHKPARIRCITYNKILHYDQKNRQNVQRN